MSQSNQEKQMASQEETAFLSADQYAGNEDYFATADEISRASEEKLNSLKALYSQQLGYESSENSPS